MRSLPRIKRPHYSTLVAAVIVCVLIVAGRSSHAGPVPWPNAPFSYFAENQKLETVLRNFATSFSLSLEMETGLTGTVNGRFTAENPTHFITRLSGVYGFSWYTYAGALYVSRSSQIVTRSISPPGGDIRSMRQALRDLGILETRFGWGELTEQGVALISGPPSYVELVEETVKRLPVSGKLDIEIAVFRLRNASADDREIQYRDRRIQIPGLATTLRNLMLRNQAASGTGLTSTNVAQQSGPEARNGLSDAPRTDGASAQNTKNDAPGAAAPGTAPRRPPIPVLVRPSIEADPRLNALIVQDRGDRMSMYRSLIDQLDVPTELIEIEAMIIDVNTERAAELGINWRGRAGSSTLGYGNIAQNPASGTLTYLQGAAGAGSSLIVDAGNYLISQIRLLESKGDARIQTRPSIITMDNVGALLDLSETFYIQTVGERVATVTPVTAGLTLKVTPRTTLKNGQQLIQLTIDIEDGSISAAPIGTLPTVSRSMVSTQAVVRSSDTLLIAGHTQDQTLGSREGVPGLSDVPLLGTLFSTKTNTTQRRERLVMIKPRIVELGRLEPAPIQESIGISSGTTQPRPQ